METGTAGDTEALFEWFFLLDHLDYYALLAIPYDASDGEVQEAFHTFADAFHPDGHVGRSTEERDALEAIFKRGNEAYGVLSDPLLRGEYDRLRQKASIRPSRLAPRLSSTLPPK
ncbi:MAG: DnaJ domain-containing protein [Myxococcales bacterium]